MRKKLDAVLLRNPMRALKKQASLVKMEKTEDQGWVVGNEGMSHSAGLESGGVFEGNLGQGEQRPCWGSLAMGGKGLEATWCSRALR